MADNKSPPLWITIVGWAIALPAAGFAIISGYAWLTRQTSSVVATASGHPFFVPKEIAPDKALGTNDLINNRALYKIGEMRRYAVVTVRNVGTNPVEALGIQIQAKECVYVVERLDTFNSPEVGTDRINLGDMGQATYQTVHIWYNATPDKNSLSVVHKAGSKSIDLERKPEPFVSGFWIALFGGVMGGAVTMIARYFIGRSTDKKQAELATQLQETISG